MQRFTVRGEGHFPVDMLRFETAVPAYEADSRRIQVATAYPREIRLIHMGMDPGWRPAQDRWESLGWEVVE